MISTLNTFVFTGKFIQDTLYLVIYRDGGVYLEKIELRPAKTDPDASYLTHLDRKIDETQVGIAYDSGTMSSTIYLPYTMPLNDVSYSVVTKAGDGSPSEDVATGTQLGYYIVIPGDWRTRKFWIGEDYEFRYGFSPAVVHSNNPLGGVSAVNASRLQVHFWYVTYEESGYFDVEVTPLLRTTSTYNFDGTVPQQVLTDPDNPAISSGTKRVMVQAKNDEVVIELANGSWLPSRFVSAEWEGVFTTKSQRI